MAAEEKILLNIKLDVAETNVKLAKLKGDIASLTEENKKLAVASKAAALAGDAASLASLNNQIVKNESTLRSYTSEQRNLRNQIDISNKANAAQSGSYEQLLRQQQLASIQLKTLEGTLKKNADGTFVLTDAYVRQSEVVRKSKEAIIAFDQGIKDGRTNVGNYSSSFVDAIEKSGLFGEALGKLRSTTDKVKAGYELINQGSKAVVSGFEDAGKAVKAISVEIGNSISTFNTWATATQKSNDAITETFTTASKTEEALHGLGAAGAAAATEIEAVGVAGVTAGEGVAAGAAIGAGGMSILATAIAATGIGLLLIAIGSLVSFFAKTEKGAEFLERAFAGIGAVVEVLIDTFAIVGEKIFNAFNNPKQALIDFGNFIKDQLINRLTSVGVILSGIATLDFSKITNGIIQMGTGLEGGTDKAKKMADAFGAIASKALSAADAAIKLKKEQQDLEDQVREQSLEVNKNNKSIETYLKLSKDVNISARDRIDALDKAGKLEKQNVVIKQDQAQKDLNITIQQKLNGKELTDIEKTRFTQLLKRTDALSEEEKQEVRLFQEKTTIRDKDLQDIVDKQNKVIDVVAESANTEILIEKRRSSAENEERRKVITANIGILDSTLKQKQLEGEQEFQLQREIAAKQRDQALLDEQLLPIEKQKIRSDFALKSAEIDKAELEFKKKITEQSTDIQLSLIADGKTREIAQEIAGFNKKLEAIIGNSESEIALRESLINESAIKIFAIEEKYRLQERTEAIAQVNKNAKAENDAIGLKYQEKENQLKISFSKEKITRDQFESNKLALVQAKLQDELILLQNQQQQKQVIDAQYFIAESQKLFDAFQSKKITEEQFNAQLIEIQKNQKKLELATLEETSVPIAAKEKEIVENKVDITIHGNDLIISDQQRTADQELQINNARLQLGGTLISGFKDLLSQDENNRKKHGDILKALALGEIGVNLIQELSSISALSASASKTAGPAAPATYAGLVSIQSAVAIARAALAAVKVVTQKFDSGGMTSKDFITMQQAVETFKPVYTSTLSGYYAKPTMSLVAEKKPEWVSPNWMINHPKTGPIISGLEKFRTTGVMPFFDGGLTSSSLSQPVINNFDVAQITDAIKAIQQPVVIVQDINDAQGTIVKVADRATV